MTDKEFDALLVRLHPKIGPAVSAQGRMLACLSVVQRLWLDRRREDEDTAQLRRQLLHLEATGHFDFSSWSTDL